MWNCVASASGIQLHRLRVQAHSSVGNAWQLQHLVLIPLCLQLIIQPRHVGKASSLLAPALLLREGVEKVPEMPVVHRFVDGVSVATRLLLASSEIERGPAGLFSHIVDLSAAVLCLQLLVLQLLVQSSVEGSLLQGFDLSLFSLWRVMQVSHRPSLSEIGGSKVALVARCGWLVEVPIPSRLRWVLEPARVIVRHGARYRLCMSS